MIKEVLHDRYQQTAAGTTNTQWFTSKKTPRVYITCKQVLCHDVIMTDYHYLELHKFDIRPTEINLSLIWSG